MGVIDDYADVTQQDILEEHGIATPSSNKAVPPTVTPDVGGGYEQMSQEQIAEQHSDIKVPDPKILQSLRDAGIANPEITSGQNNLSLFFNKLNPLSEGSPAEQFAAGAGLVGEDAALITGNQALVEALNIAIKDGTFNKTNLTQAFNGGSSTEALKQILQDSQKTKILTRVLTKIGDGSVDADGNDITVAHLVNLSKAEGQAEQLKQLEHMGIAVPLDFDVNDFFKFLAELMQNPELAINNLVNDLVDAGKIDPEHANLAKGYGTEIGGAVKFMFKPYYELVQDHRGIGSRINQSMENNGQESTDKYGAPATVAATDPITKHTDLAQADANRGLTTEKTGENITEVTSLKTTYDPYATGVTLGTPDVTPVADNVNNAMQLTA